LMEKNFAYEKLRSVYFDISKLADYGSLSNIDLSRTRRGNSVDLDDYDKDSPADFALFKRSTLSELKSGLYFKTRWGSARPSWHLGCAAVTHKYLGPVYDINIGGVDEIFPHGENILAVHKAYSGRSGANYWLSTELVLVGGRKMSRSLGNTITLRQLMEKGYSGTDVRFFLMAVNYRKPIHYSEASLTAAKNTVKKLQGFVDRLLSIDQPRSKDGGDIEQLIYDLKSGFTASLDDDLNIAAALAAIFEFMGKVNVLLSQQAVGVGEARKIVDVLRGFNEVLGIMRFENKMTDADADAINALIAKRNHARKERNWQEADAIREQLFAMGVDILDTEKGTVWRLR